MKYLIDTHIFIWFIQNSPSLNNSIKALIEDENNEILISIASIWKLSIKNSIGKLNLVKGFESISDYLKDKSIKILPLNFSHTVENNRLPFYHRDPFDRIIVAQAIVENLGFISSDAVFDDYLNGKSVRRIY